MLVLLPWLHYPLTLSVVQSYFWDVSLYSCGLSNATIEYMYSSPSVCPCVCLSWCNHDNSKNIGSIQLKLEHIVVYRNSSDDFDIGHCPIKVKVTA